MSSSRPTPPSSSATTPVRSIDWRASITGGLLIFLALVVALFLDTSWDAVSTFRISRPRDVWAVGNLTVPSQWFNTIAAIALAFLGTRLFLRGGGRWTALAMGTGLVILAMAFLVWATADKAISLTGMLHATLVRAVPIALAALAGILCERVAVINIGIEGMLLAGAFAGAMFGSLMGDGPVSSVRC